MAESEYQRKRRFEETPEPPGTGVEGDIDPLTAPPGDRFVIHQHHATALHHDLRLEMFNGPTPVLVSWAVPKRLPRNKEKKTLAIRTEDHPIQYLDFNSDIPDGYGKGAVRIFDTGRYEMVERSEDRMTFRLDGSRQRGVFHLINTGAKDGKEQWLAIMSKDERPRRQKRPLAEPMLATLASDPFDDPEWAFEPKWDGIRAIAICDGATTLLSRNQRDITAAYPELHRLHDQLVAHDAMVDGEIVALENGVPSFQLLQRRMHVRDPEQIERLTKEIPVCFMVFDALYLDGENLTSLSYEERRERLEACVVPSPILQLSPSTIGNGVALFDAVAKQQMEGVMGKKLTSTYEPGGRSKYWLKFKTKFDADVVIVGWTEGTGHRIGTIGSLAMAVYDDGELRYVGQVGTGFTERTLPETMKRLEELGEVDDLFPPGTVRPAYGPRTVHWVPPRLVAMVEYRQVTAAGRLRVPSFKGLRDDKLPEQCTFDQLQIG